MREPLIVIRTTERQGGVDYLPELVEDLDREGFSGLVLTDGPQPRKFLGWEARATGERLGSRRCGWRALELADGQGMDLVLLEDDVRPVRGTVGRLVTFRVPDRLAWVSFFDATARPRVAGLHELPCELFHFAQAVKFPHRTVATLAARNPADFRAPGFSPVHAFDSTLAAFCAGSSYGLVLPNWIEHRGDVSVVWPGRMYPFRSAWLAQPASEDDPTLVLGRPWREPPP